MTQGPSKPPEHGFHCEHRLPGQGCPELWVRRALETGFEPQGSAATAQPSGRTHTSSIRIRGFSVLVFFRHCMIFPGMAPTYVRLGKRACWAVSACLIH